ncbi:MAG: hypothetical protein QOH06_2115 [Acidobacteriota bacterium]|jgi:hypothetical protein|nr:hypothetical protein [Acidobacteriota bacterium]
MRRIPAVLAPILALILCTALPAAGQGIVNSTISGNSIEITVALPGGLGADVSISFEEVTGLSLANLGLSAQVANTLSPAFRARLPNGVLPVLPLLLRIEPPASGGLSFSGVTDIDIHTHNLLFAVGTPLRFFSAPLGGKFEDVTAAMGAGSYRARATKGGFSEFLIVADLRSRNQVIAAKFDRLEELLGQYEGSLSGSVYEDLEERLAAAHADYTGGSAQAAIAEIDGFVAVVEQHSGTDIPDVWRSARDVQNVAGYLRGAALTLRFSLGLKSTLLGL